MSDASEQSSGQGIEVLLMKAAVDPAFRETLVAHRFEVAAQIGLELTDEEQQMLQSLPAEQLAAAIENMEVEPDLQPVFLGTSVAAMLAAVRALQEARESQVFMGGIRPGEDDDDDDWEPFREIFRDELGDDRDDTEH